MYKPKLLEFIIPVTQEREEIIIKKANRWLCWCYSMYCTIYHFAQAKTVQCHIHITSTLYLYDCSFQTAQTLSFNHYPTRLGFCPCSLDPYKRPQLHDTSTWNFLYQNSYYYIPEAKDIIVQLESQCTSLHQANRKVKEEMEKLQENMELSRDREMCIHNELSRTIVQVI